MAMLCPISSRQSCTSARRSIDCPGSRSGATVARRDDDRRRGERADGRRWLWVVGLLAAIVVVVVAVSSVRSIQRANALARLPQIPDSLRPEALKAHLTEADRAARAAGASVDQIGALCIAYHADLLYDQAEQCYEVVEVLEPGAWRWTYYRALVQGARGDTDEFATVLRDVTRLAPDSSLAWWQLGDAEFKAGRRDLAREAWQRAVALPE